MSLLHPFSATLLEWGAQVQRPMPWRGEKNPYKVWLSEVILQQTRVAQGEAYYKQFVSAFPTVDELANASEDEVLSLWQGLGYYSRARNLHKAAKLASQSGFPKSYTELLKLPGVGSYTAAAVASFSYDEPVAVVDGNVYRVLARYFGLDAPIDKPVGQKKFRELADELLPEAQSAAYNQAIMDFGAIVCKPKLALCSSCPLADTCVAFSSQTVDVLPVKAGKIKRRDRHFNYLHLENASGSILLCRRGSGDIWQGLYDMPLLETVGDFASQDEILDYLNGLGISKATFIQKSLPKKHVLSHQDIFACFWKFRIEPSHGEVKRFGSWVSSTHLKHYGIPRLLDRYLSSAEHTLPFN